MSSDRLKPVKIEGYQVDDGRLRIFVIQSGSGIHGPNWPIADVSIDYEEDRVVIGVVECVPAPSQAAGRVVAGHVAGIRRSLEAELAEGLRGRTVVDRATGEPVPAISRSSRRPSAPKGD